MKKIVILLLTFLTVALSSNEKAEKNFSILYLVYGFEFSYNIVPGIGLGYRYTFKDFILDTSVKWLTNCKTHSIKFNEGCYFLFSKKNKIFENFYAGPSLNIGFAQANFFNHYVTNGEILYKTNENTLFISPSLVVGKQISNSYFWELHTSIVFCSQEKFSMMEIPIIFLNFGKSF
jgi:hypothetical protein